MSVLVRVKLLKRNIRPVRVRFNNSSLCVCGATIHHIKPNNSPFYYATGFTQERYHVRWCGASISSLWLVLYVKFFFHVCKFCYISMLMLTLLKWLNFISTQIKLIINQLNPSKLSFYLIKTCSGIFSFCIYL